jgi:hypothetical protein
VKGIEADRAGERYWSPAAYRGTTLFLSRSPPVRIEPLKGTTPLTDYVIDLAPAHRVLRLTAGKNVDRRDPG